MMMRSLTAACCMFVAVCLVSVTAVSQEALAADPATGWDDAVMLEFLNAGFMDPGSPHVAADAFGNAFAVWDQYDGSRNCVFASRYVRDVGWVGPELIDSAGTDSCSNPKVAVDGAGNAIAVWQQSTSWTNSVWANRYVVGEGWGYAQLIETHPEEAGLARVVVDSTGNATALWEQWDSGHNHIWSNRYVVGEDWGTAEEVEGYAEDGFFIDAAVDGGGNVVVVWCQWDATFYNISANRYVPGEGWGASEMIGGNANGSVAEPRVYVDSSGNATAAWCQFDDGRYSVWANRYVIGEGWGTAELLEDEDSDDALFPRLAGDGSGTVMVVWQQPDGGVGSIWSNLYAPGEGWGMPELVENNSLYAYIPQVVMDELGRGTALWTQWDGSRNALCSARYLPGEGWGEMELASTNATGSTSYAYAAAGGMGDVFAAWLQYDDMRYNVWGNVYKAPPDMTPPPISIDSPSDGFTTESPTVAVSGTTEPGATVELNGVYVAVGLDGSFSYVMALLEGENTITATATDISGNSATDSVNVTYVNPVYALMEELADALAQVDALQAQLDSALADLADLQAQLDNATEDVTELEAQLAAAEAALADAQDELADALADLADIESQLADSEADVLALQLQLALALANVTAAEEDLAEAEQELADVEEQLASAEDDLDASDSLNTLLVAAIVAASVVAAVMAIMYFRLRKGQGGVPEKD